MVTPFFSPEVAAGKREPAPEVMCHAHHIRSPPPEVNHHQHDRLSPRHSLGSRLEAKYGSPYRQLKYSRSCIELGSVRRTSFPLQDAEDTEEGEGEGEGEGAVRSSRPGVSASGGRGAEEEEEERSEAAFTALVHSSELSSAPVGDCNAGEVGGAAPTTGKVGSLAVLSGGVSSCLPGESTPSIGRIENEESQTNRNETKRAGLFIIGDTDYDDNASSETEDQDDEEMLRKLPELGRETIHSIHIL